MAHMIVYLTVTSLSLLALVSFHKLSYWYQVSVM